MSIALTLGMVTTVRTTEIAYAHEYFLYLPLFFAEHKKFFGLLPKGEEVRFVRSSFATTDAAVFKRLMDVHSDGNRAVDFAVCDPAQVLLHTDQRSHPAVVAGLITNAAFWAVNHKANKTQLLEHLANFDKIISFKPGTTSFGIASRICGANKEKITQVETNQELTTLTGSESGALALSPDILGIQNLLKNGNDRFGIELALAETTEYRDALVTALITRRDVVESKLELVEALLHAVQRSLLEVRSATDEVLKFAADRFGFEENLIRLSLEEATNPRSGNVYPADITISRATWLKLAEIASHASGTEFGSSEQTRADETYRLYVEPHGNMVIKAVNTDKKSTPDIKQPFKPSYRRIVSDSWLPLLAITVLLITCVFFIDSLGLDTCVVAVVLAAIGIWVADWAKIKQWSFDALEYWVSCVLFIGGTLILINHSWAKATIKQWQMIDEQTIDKFLSISLLAFTASALAACYRVVRKTKEKEI